MAHNKYLTFLFLGDNDSISAKSAAQILSKSPVDFSSFQFFNYGLCNSLVSCSFTFAITPISVFLLENLYTILGNALWYLSYSGFIAISWAVSFKFLSEIV